MNKNETESDTPQTLIDWSRLYDEVPIEKMPWFNPALDDDLASELEKRGISGGKFLDLGTGPGTQAIELARKGFAVWGTDLSPTAIEKAERREGGENVHFVQDDILQSKVMERFDYIFDRGCFHVLRPEEHEIYIANICRLLNPSGLVFIKTFSVEETWDQGPRRFSRGDFQTIFSSAFKIESVIDTKFTGPATVDHDPRALFATLRKIRD